VTLFEQVVDAAERMASQDTEDTVDAEEVEDDPAPTDEVQTSLAVLGLSALPETVVELNKVMKAALFKAHPDKNFNDPSSNERVQEVLAARKVLLKQYNI
jgi:hypothetical protein